MEGILRPAIFGCAISGFRGICGWQMPFWSQIKEDCGNSQSSLHSHNYALRLIVLSIRLRMRTKTIAPRSAGSM
jgi:hypothetical protein